MAASVALNRWVDPQEIVKRLCGQAGGSCPPLSYLGAQAADIEITPLEGYGPGKSRGAAQAECEDQKEARIGAIRAQLAKPGGATLVGFVPGGFPKRWRDNPGSLHFFAVQAVDSEGALYLKDGADTAPVTYKLGPSKFCRFTTVPRTLSSTTPLDSAPEWSFNGWGVSRKKTTGSLPDGGQQGEPPEPALVENDDVPGQNGDDPFDLGAYQLPRGYEPAPVRRADGIAFSPGTVWLRLGVAQGEAAAVSSWLSRLETECNVLPIGSGRFLSNMCRGSRSPLEVAYAQPDAKEVSEMHRLARHFEVAAQRVNGGRRWLLSAIVRFVQSIPYELVPEDPMGLRPPAKVLSQYAGDCDSKSFLAAVMLHSLGFQTAVVGSDSRKHAVLGVASRDFSGATVESGGVSYLLTEMTALRPIGDVEMARRLLPGEDDWVVTPVGR